LQERWHRTSQPFTTVQYRTTLFRLAGQEAFEKCWTHSPRNRRTPIQQVSLPVLSHAACSSMSTTTTRDRGDRYGPMEWAQKWQRSEPSTNRREAKLILTTIVCLFIPSGVANGYAVGSQLSDMLSSQR